MGFLPWEIRVAFPGESQLQLNRATQLTVHAGSFNVSIIHRTLTWPTGSLTCAQMLMRAIAHEGCTDTVRESALKVDSGRKSLAALGNRTCVGSVPVQCCNRLSYIPSHKHSNIPVISMELYSNPLCGFVLYTEGTQLVG